MQALVYPYLTIFCPVCTTVNWHQWFTITTVNNDLHQIRLIIYRNHSFLDVSHVMGIPWNDFLIEVQSFDYLIILVFWLCNEKFCTQFLQRVIASQKYSLLFKKMKIFKSSNSSRVHCFSLKFSTCVLKGNTYKKFVKEIFFFFLNR